MFLGTDGSDGIGQYGLVFSTAVPHCPKGHFSPSEPFLLLDKQTDLLRPPCWTQDDSLAIVPSPSSCSGLLGPGGSLGEQSPQWACRAPSQPTLTSGRPGELGGTSTLAHVGCRAPQLPCFLPPWWREVARSAQDNSSVPEGAKPGAGAPSQSGPILGLGLAGRGPPFLGIWDGRS